MQTINPIVNRWRSEAAASPNEFWARAADALPWFRKWDDVFQWDFPAFRWFSGATTNIAYNCIDRHVERGWGGHAAIAIRQRARRAQRTHIFAAQA